MAKHIKTACHFCEKDTYHNVLYTKNVKESSGLSDEDAQYITLECGGCHSISFLIRVDDSSSIDDEQSYTDWNFSLKSADAPEFRFLRDEDQDELPTKTSELYDQVKNAFNKELDILAGTGLRMLVESVCLHEKLTGRNLQENIQQLHNTGMISRTELPILDKLRLIGNQSAHEIKSFPMEKLAYALDIINHILISIYVLPKINKRLKV